MWQDVGGQVARIPEGTEEIEGEQGGGESLFRRNEDSGDAREESTRPAKHQHMLPYTFPDTGRSH